MFINFFFGMGNPLHSLFSLYIHTWVQIYICIEVALRQSLRIESTPIDLSWILEITSNKSPYTHPSKRTNSITIRRIVNIIIPNRSNIFHKMLISLININCSYHHTIIIKPSIPWNISNFSRTKSARSIYNKNLDHFLPICIQIYYELATADLSHVLVIAIRTKILLKKWSSSANLRG